MEPGRHPQVPGPEKITRLAGAINTLFSLTTTEPGLIELSYE